MYIFSFEIFGFTLAPSYYGLMYVISFVLGYMFLKYYSRISQKLLDDIIWYVFLGVILGGRIGYMLFYNFSSLVSDPVS
ncbi:prolipoprotein diacylglyceryl transferase, partial [Candidatus Gracilibacteria bacterium]|nr:prolipoprotein diacylglyceryl transferase [Candidatus Gracilibacteria bacterium]